MHLPNTPRDAEEARLMGIGITPEVARDDEELRVQPADLTVATPNQRARDTEEKRLASGQR